jgi:hypothetical protein
VGGVPLLRRVTYRSASGRHDCSDRFGCGNPRRGRPGSGSGVGNHGRRFYGAPIRTCAPTVAEPRGSGTCAEVGRTMQRLWRSASGRGAFLHDLRDDGRMIG